MCLYLYGQILMLRLFVRGKFLNCYAVTFTGSPPHLIGKPTIFTNVSNDMRIAKEEIFGPVLSIIPFESEEEAISIVNDTSYGLGNYVQTQDMEKAKRVAKKFRSGGVYINGNSADPGTPFGGYKQSGNGREGGKWGLEEYLEVKTICGWK